MLACSLIRLTETALLELIEAATIEAWLEATDDAVELAISERVIAAD
ncbi:hypothetical protein OfM1_20200 [Lactovum odontotermitis]